MPDIRKNKLLKSLSSLKLMVFLMVLTMILVFFGTLAQRFEGNWTVVGTYFRSLMVMIPLKHILPQNFRAPDFSFPFPGGFLLGALLLLNLVAAFITTFKITAKRTGILVIHLGLIVLLLGEFITGIFAVESNMTLTEGSYANFSEDIRTTELVLIDTSDPESDTVIAIPQSHLQKAFNTGQPVSPGNASPNIDLPFNITVTKYYPAANIVDLQRAAMNPHTQLSNPATAGFGTDFYLAMPVRAETGTDLNQSSDTPAAYLTISPNDSDKPLGTFIVSPLITAHQPITDSQGKTWQLALRFKRIYHPYQIHLIKATHEQFVGSTINKNFASDIRLVDPANNEDRNVHIWMNHPMRYRGQTFFQYQMNAGIGQSVLQVVDNPGWTLPYISCTFVSLGLLLHFVLMLIKYTRSPGSKKARAPAANASTPLTPRPKLHYAIITLTALIALGYIASPMMRPDKSPNTDQYNFADFARIPVTDQGRVKPLDTVARSTLLQIRDKQTYRDDQGNTYSAAAVLFNILSHPAEAAEYKIFRNDNPDIKDMLKVEDPKEHFFSFSQLSPHIQTISDHAQKADEIAAADRSLYQNDIINLFNKLRAYRELQTLTRPYYVPPSPPSKNNLNTSEGEWIALTTAMQSAAHTRQPLSSTAQNLQDIFLSASLTAEGTFEQAKLMHFATLMSSLPTSMPQDLQGTYIISTSQLITPAAEKAPAANYRAALSNHLLDFQKNHPNIITKTDFEVFFNKLQPFYAGLVLYLAAFILLIFSFLFSTSTANVNTTDPPQSIFRKLLPSLAFTIILIAFALHTFALAARIYITERPPVTNLYSSAVFIGYFTIVIALAFEHFNRNGIALLLSSLIGFATLIVAHNLATGDTMQMMQAVLDSNFWLATHVIIVTIGYSAVFFAGFIALYYILLGVYTKRLTKDLAAKITRMIYATTAFALLFSFVGTVLGGIWADQSWGRFWGWDPKENGAVLIVLLTAIILHARWGGMIKQRGIAALAVLGNVITAFSWFGTNMLGVGLHSYGFMSSAYFWLWAFIAANLAVMAIAFLPLRNWASYVPLTANPPKSIKAIPNPRNKQFAGSAK
ncbi:cytochrome c biogenesis protein CcsA [Poriferisphaera sp. WC338]|uniref:cytochrome c biogenesis protein CcsA n=1 Tax=Poriferisphaera sp. WC338 TaxID=3425129 RepID=UPI003D813342